MILCSGEALIDMIPGPSADGQESFTPHPGGSVFNTAIALGRLGAPVGLLTGLSTDMFGQQLRTALEQSQVNTAHVILSDRPTTLAFVKLVNGQASYQFYDENSAGRMLLPGHMPALSREVSTLFFGGISLACEPCADAYAALLENEKASRVVMLDPNIRPQFIQNHTRFRARLNRMIAQSNIIKVSDEDLGWLAEGDSGFEDKAQALLNMGPDLVVVTRGEKGATGFLANGLDVSVPAPQSDVVDTVGAG
ncbi:MAG: carbohydrate kinase, partial [Arenibacterium sp.]